jgi:hypothetical protein
LEIIDYGVLKRRWRICNLVSVRGRRGICRIDRYSRLCVGLKNTFQYVVWAAEIALGLSIILFFPLSLFNRTRPFAIGGLAFSSIVFGFCTWVLGFVVTYTYWGPMGVLIGLFLGVVGIVPLGMIAAGFAFDWITVALLFVGILITYAIRFYAIWLERRQMLASYY